MTTTIVLNDVDYEWVETVTGPCLRKAGRQKAQVGATKTVNGKTYYLNDNRRWALKREGNTQPKAKQEPRQKAKQAKPKLQALDGGGQSSGRSEFAKPVQQLLQAKQGTDAAMGRMMETKAKIEKKYGKNKKPKAEKVPIAQIHKEVKAMAKQVSPEVLEQLKAESRKGNRLYARPLHEKLKAAIGQSGQLKPKLQAIDGGKQKELGDMSLGELFSEADRVGNKYQTEPSTLDEKRSAKQSAQQILDESGMSEAIGRASGKVRQLKPKAKAKENLAQQIQAPNSIVYVDEDSPTDIVVTSPENKMRTEAQFASQGREMQMFGRQHKTFLAEYANLLSGGKPSPMSLISPSNLSLADAISTPGARVFVSSETPGKFAVAEPGDAGYMRLSAQLANADEDYIELSRQQFGVVREYLNAHKAKQSPPARQAPGTVTQLKPKARRDTGITPKQRPRRSLQPKRNTAPNTESIPVQSPQEQLAPALQHIATSPEIQAAAQQAPQINEAIQRLRSMGESFGSSALERLSTLAKNNPGAVEDVAVAAIAMAGQFAVMPQADLATAAIMQGAIGVATRAGSRAGRRIRQELKADPNTLKSIHGAIKLGKGVLSDLMSAETQEKMIGDAIGPAMAGATGAAVGGGLAGAIAGTGAAVGGAPKAAQAIQQGLKAKLRPKPRQLTPAKADNGLAQPTKLKVKPRARS